MSFLRHPVATVTVSALVVRLAYCVLIVHVGGKGPPGGTAHDGYVEIAQSLLAGDGYRLLDEPNFFRPPTYVLFLIPWAALPGSHVWMVVVQSVVGAATCGMVTRVALRFVRPLAAILSGLALALCPWHVHFTANGMSPVLAAFLLMSFLMWWLADRQSLLAGGGGRIGRAGLGGGLYAVLALCHPGAALVGPVWIVDRLRLEWRRGRLRAGLGGVGLFVVGGGLVFSPWIIRNRIASGEWVVLSNSVGFQYFVAADMVQSTPSVWSLPATGAWHGLDEAAALLDRSGFPPSKTLRAFKGVGIAEGKFFVEWMKRDLSEHPATIARRLVQQGWWFWFGDGRSMVIWHVLYKLPLLLLAVLGLWKGFRRSEPIAPMLGCVMAVWAVHALIIGYIPLAVYCLPVIGPVCVLAAVGLPRSWARGGAGGGAAA